MADLGSSFLAGVDFESGRQRAMWVAPYTAMIMWMLSLLFLFFADDKQRRHPSASAVPPNDDAYMKPNSYAERMARATRTARINFIMLFSSTVITALGYGATDASVILIWLSFAFGFVWTIAETAADSHWLRVLCSIVMFPLIIAVWGLAFRRRILF